MCKAQLCWLPTAALYFRSFIMIVVRSNASNVLDFLQVQTDWFNPFGHESYVSDFEQLGTSFS